MDVPIIDVIEWKLIATEPHITFIIKPYFGWVKVLDQNPLSYIKFSAFNQQRMLYILLDNKLDISAKTIIGDIIDIIEASNSSSPWHNYVMVKIYSWVSQSRHFDIRSFQTEDRFSSEYQDNPWFISPKSNRVLPSRLDHHTLHQLWMHLCFWGPSISLTITLNSLWLLQYATFCCFGDYLPLFRSNQWEIAFVNLLDLSVEIHCSSFQDIHSYP